MALTQLLVLDRDDIDSDVPADATDESQLTVSKEEFSLKPGEKFVVRDP